MAGAESGLGFELVAGVRRVVAYVLQYLAQGAARGAGGASGEEGSGFFFNANAFRDGYLDPLLGGQASRVGA